MTPEQWDQLKPGDIVRRTDPRNPSSYRVMEVRALKKTIDLSPDLGKEHRLYLGWQGSKDYCHLYEFEHRIVCI